VLPKNDFVVFALSTTGIQYAYGLWGKAMYVNVRPAQQVNRL